MIRYLLKHRIYGYLCILLIACMALSLVLVFANITFASIAHGNDLSKNKDLNCKLQSFVGKARKKLRCSALELSVLTANQKIPLAFMSGKTELKDGKNLSANTLFQVGSITKTFTALLIAKAIQSKKLTMGDKLGKFLPNYPRWKDITIEQLVNQTSGIFDYIQSKDWWHKLYKNMNKTWQPSTLLQIAYEHPGYFKPGKGWSYSNTNYVLLGRILKKVNKKSMSLQINDLIKSSDLNNTYYIPKPVPKEILARMAHGYYNNKDDMTLQNTSWLQSAGAIISTPKDLTIWMSGLFDRQTGLPDIPYLSLKQTNNGNIPTSLKQTAYSFGLFRMNTPEGIIWFTPGLTPGYISMMVYVPRLDVFFAYSVNNVPEKFHGIHEYMIMNIIKRLSNCTGYKKFLESNVKLPKYSVKSPYSDRFIFPHLN